MRGDAEFRRKSGSGLNNLDIMPVSHRFEDLFNELLGEQERAPGLTGEAEISGLARERNKMLGSTAGTPGKSSMKPAAVEESLDCGADHGSKRTHLGLEPLLVAIEVVIEVLVEQLVESGSFGLSWPIDRRRGGFRKDQPHTGWWRRNTVGEASSGSGRMWRSFFVCLRQANVSLGTEVHKRRRLADRPRSLGAPQLHRVVIEFGQ